MSIMVNGVASADSGPQFSHFQFCSCCWTAFQVVNIINLVNLLSVFPSLIFFPQSSSAAALPIMLIIVWNRIEGCSSRGRRNRKQLTDWKKKGRKTRRTATIGNLLTGHYRTAKEEEEEEDEEDSSPGDLLLYIVIRIYNYTATAAHQWRDTLQPSSKERERIFLSPLFFLLSQRLELFPFLLLLYYHTAAKWSLSGITQLNSSM